MNQIDALSETVALAEQHGMPELPGSELGLDHLRSMLTRVNGSEFSPAKLGPVARLGTVRPRCRRCRYHAGRHEGIEPPSQGSPMTRQHPTSTACETRSSRYCMMRTHSHLQPESSPTDFRR